MSYPFEDQHIARAYSTVVVLVKVFLDSSMFLMLVFGICTSRPCGMKTSPVCLIFIFLSISPWDSRPVIPVGSKLTPWPGDTHLEFVKMIITMFGGNYHRNMWWRLGSALTFLVRCQDWLGVRCKVSKQITRFTIGMKGKELNKSNI